MSRMNLLTEHYKTAGRWQRGLLAAGVVFLGLSVTRVITGADDLTSGATFIATIATASPILFAALGGLYSERAGIANIGLEGMMIMGTWFAGFAGWHWGPWAALVGGAFGGMLFGLLHAVATVTFGVDQIVSGVAINLTALGVVRFLSSEVFVGAGDNGEGTITNSPAVDGRMGTFTMPVLSDFLEWVDEKRWFFVSDVAGALRAFVDNVSWATMIALLLIPFTIYLLWHTAFGLRLRSAGEKPSAAESLGVGVYRVKYIAVAISGALAGLGGAWLVVDVRKYAENQVSGRGYIGLAALIFGNWQPIGVGLGAALFAYGISLQQAVGTKPIKALYLFLAGTFLVMALVMVLRQQSKRAAAGLAVAGAGLLSFYLTTDVVNNQLVYITPYVIVLVVITFASETLAPAGNRRQTLAEWAGGLARPLHAARHLHLDAAPRPLGEHDGHAVRFRCTHHLGGDVGGQCFGEHGKIAEAPEEELEALALDAMLIGLVVDDDARQIGLVGDRANAHQLVRREPHIRHMRRRREDLDVVDGMAHRAAQDSEVFGERIGGAGEIHHRKGYGEGSWDAFSPTSKLLATTLTAISSSRLSPAANRAPQCGPRDRHRRRVRTERTPFGVHDQRARPGHRS